jgi:hypothetical protein
MLPDGGAAFGPTSAQLALTVSMPTLSLQQTGDGSGLAFASHVSLGAGGGNWLHFDTASIASLLPQGDDVLLYATDANGTPLVRDGLAGADATIENATLGRIGSLQSDGGLDLLKANQTLFLPDDQQLHFAVLNADGTIDAHPTVQITTSPGGLLTVHADGLGFSVKVDNTVTDQTYLANDQHNADLPVFNLSHGEAVQVQVAGSAADVNALHFVRVNVDATTGAWSVGGVAYANTNAFRAAVQANWDQGIAVQDGHGTFQDSGTWTVAGKSGFYVPVLATQNGDVFVPGTANVDGHDHVRMFGQNTFGFEDLRADQHSDFDYNDMVVKVTAGWLTH